jgi:hypothetical protein
LGEEYRSLNSSLGANTTDNVTEVFAILDLTALMLQPIRESNAQRFAVLIQPDTGLGFRNTYSRVSNGEGAKHGEHSRINTCTEK